MWTRTALLSSLCFTVVVFAQVSPKAKAIHDSALVIDTHADTPQRFLDGNFDIASTDPKDPGHVSLDKARAGNLGAVFFSIWVSPKFNEGHFARNAFDLIDSVYEQAATHPDRMMMAFSTADIQRAHKTKKLAALMGLEGGHAIENDIHLLRNFYRLGIRYMTLSWANTNEWADSSGDQNDPKVQRHNGLTEFGKQVVLEMNRLGMMVDVSHVSDKTMSDALDVSQAPIIASHSSARALSNVPRNIPDDLLKRIGEKGGVIQVNFYSGFVDTDTVSPQSEARDARLKTEQDAINEKYKDDPERRGEESDKLEAANPLPPLPISKLIDHIDHIVKVAGIDHVGIGADFDGANDMPEGARDVSMLPNITYELLKRGYSEKDIRKILGENFLRVFGEVERVSVGMSKSISGDGSTKRISK